MNSASPDLIQLSPGAAGNESVLLSALLNEIPEFVYFKDRDSRFLAVSASMVRLFKRKSPEELVGRTDFDFFNEEHARLAFNDEQEIIRTGVPIVAKLEREVWPDGRITWAVTTKLPLRDEAGDIIGTYGMSRDVTDSKQMEAELEKAHKDLVGASRIAGMAEVATGVLHNVGNVLNSLNVSASVISTGLRQSKAESLARIASLLHEHEADLSTFLTTDPKGKRVPEFLSSLAQHTVEERERLLQEVGALQKNIDHIKEIVAMQQAYATMIGVVEALDPVTLLEDSLRMNAGALLRHDVHVERDYHTVPAILGEKAKVLQILVNLIRNAKYACDDGAAANKCMTLRLRTAGPDRVQLIVHDNGVGIPAENLTRIFQHGFTTRANGHGFGLHSAANAAREMKGSLTATSNGIGTGATFTLELPVAPASIPSE
jgi:PAS domain S-box-containing protein